MDRFELEGVVTKKLECMETLDSTFCDGGHQIDIETYNDISGQVVVFIETADIHDTVTKVSVFVISSDSNRLIALDSFEVAIDAKLWDAYLVYDF